MKTLMTAAAAVALAAASPAFGQGQDQTEYPSTGGSPAITEPMAPEQAAPPEIMAPEPAQPDTGAAAESQDQPEQAVAIDEKFVAQQSPDEMLASALIGTSVQNPAGESLGDINDVALSEDGQADVIVIGVGGFLGIGEKNVGVPFDMIEPSTDANGNAILTLNASAEALEAAPTFVTIKELLSQQQAEQPAAPAPRAMAPATPAEPAQ
jgi:sporulation protein YlmC with PRC-barrel domain